ncbi:WGR domain-containing protein [Sinirhodobacter populi]|uniref:WGR domain-containing protein n=2 Tax=Paenirhodobacter populi TaxID=2306993 RepID=A0A443IRL9_9RHOB|nr:WGR domain-containing protein [Sinirhodobacter populi]RWR25890.1 WGR domain-containing protein [Sinirhodobacter populi]RWR26207.1 WGR domain-containing protein [Sinirhodobacter populi]
MQDESDPSVHLLRIDAGRNMRRFYAAGLQPTLFGGASVMRYWGRIGSSGRIMIETFESPEEARLALGKLVRGKRKRGYFEGKDPCAVSEERPDSEAPLIDTTEERPAGRLHRLSND